MKNPFSRRDILQIEKPECIATILFCDIKGYIKPATGLTPIQAIGRINAFSKIVTDTIEENHGTVAKFVGDALFAYWLEEKRPDHAALACRFATSIGERLSNLPFETKSHVGIHTGLIALASIDYGTYRSLEPFGEAVNTASGLNGACSLYNAKALASETVIQLARDASGWTKLDPVQVKGKKDPVTLYGLM